MLRQLDLTRLMRYLIGITGKQGDVTMRWQDKLNETDLRHLKCMGVSTLTQFKKTAEDHAKWRREGPNSPEPCWSCKLIAKKLGLEV